MEGLQRILGFILTWCVVTADGDSAETNTEVDPFELIDAVDILSKIPKDYYEKIVSGQSVYFSGSGGILFYRGSFGQFC